MGGQPCPGKRLSRIALFDSADTNRYGRIQASLAAARRVSSSEEISGFKCSAGQKPEGSSLKTEGGLNPQMGRAHTEGSCRKQVLWKLGTTKNLWLGKGCRIMTFVDR